MINLSNISFVEALLVLVHLVTTFYVLAAGVYAFAGKKPRSLRRFVQTALRGWFTLRMMTVMVSSSVFSVWLWWYLDYAVLLQVSLAYFAFLYAVYMPVIYVLLRRAHQRAYLDRVVPSL